MKEMLSSVTAVEQFSSFQTSIDRHFQKGYHECHLFGCTSCAALSTVIVWVVIEYRVKSGCLNH